MKKKPAPPIIISPEQFAKLSQAKRAMLLAQDVIGQIALKHIEVVHMTYCHVDLSSPINDVDRMKPLTPDLISMTRGFCQVCAKGAAFISHLKLANKAVVCELQNGNGDGPIRERLCDGDSSVFPQRMYDLIEVAFEQTWEFFDPWLDANDHIFLDADREYSEVGAIKAPYRDKVKAALNFCPNVTGDRRLVAIMVNIIANKGKFVPTKHVTKAQIDKALKEAVVVTPDYSGVKA